MTHFKVKIISYSLLLYVAAFPYADCYGLFVAAR